jgi:hypothetical protein
LSSHITMPSSMKLGTCNQRDPQLPSYFMILV